MEDLKMVCRACGQAVASKDLGVIAWQQVDGNNLPMQPVLIHKSIIDACNSKSTWPFSEGIDAFIAQYPDVVIIQ